jgi:hypothetical protein
MKKLIVVSVVVAALAAMMVGTALAAGPTPPGTCGACDGTGMGEGRERVTWAGLPNAVVHLLGMDAESIQAERLSGESLAAIAAEKGITKETLVTTIVDAKREAVAAAVQAGTITQEQADLRLQQMETRIPLMVERTTTRPAFGQAGGRWGAGGMGRWSTTP